MGGGGGRREGVPFIDAHTHYFGRHGRTDSHWQRNSADRDPSDPVDSFDHRATSTFSPLLLELPSQNPCTAFHVSVLSLLSTTIFLCPSVTQVGPVISFLIVFPEHGWKNWNIFRKKKSSKNRKKAQKKEKVFFYRKNVKSINGQKMYKKFFLKTKTITKGKKRFFF